MNCGRVRTPHSASCLLFLSIGIFHDRDILFLDCVNINLDCDLNKFRFAFYYDFNLIAVIYAFTVSRVQNKLVLFGFFY